MNELIPQAQRLLEAARATPPRPGSQARERMRAAVVGASAAGALSIVGVKPASMLHGLAVKLLVGAAAAVVGGGAVWTHHVLANHATAPVPPAVTPAPVAAAPAPVAVAEEPQPVAPSAQAAAAQTPDPAPTAAAAAPVPQRAPQAKAAVPPADATPSTPARAAAPARAPSIADEVAALQLALSHVDGRRFDQALEALDGYDARFPKGELSVEARALRALTLCGLGRTDDARALGAELLKTGTSPTLMRLRASCVAQ
jgi:TolA-binding protein